jgi:hypothetical protein
MQWQSPTTVEDGEVRYLGEIAIRPTPSGSW